MWNLTSIFTALGLGFLVTKGTAGGTYFNYPLNPFTTWQIGNDLDVCAKTIWGEARGEGSRGMQAVANVIRNRYLKAQRKIGKVVWWGTSFTSICQKKNYDSARRVYSYQFSCWDPKDPNRAKMAALKPGSDANFDMALNIARQMLAGTLPDITNGADHYYATYIGKPYWAVDETPVASIGQHRFYELA